MKLSGQRARIVSQIDCFLGLLRRPVFLCLGRGKQVLELLDVVVFVLFWHVQVYVEAQLVDVSLPGLKRGTPCVLKGIRVRGVRRPVVVRVLVTETAHHGGSERIHATPHLHGVKAAHSRLHEAAHRRRILNRVLALVCVHRL